jgi:hypothetical protein
MVGETQARKFARNTDELVDMFKAKKLAARQRIFDTKKMLGELERDLAALEAEESAWDAAIFELENVGVQTGPKKRKHVKEEEDEENEEEERE